MIFNFNNNLQKGFTALTSTLIISAVIFILVISMFDFSSIEMDKNISRYNSEKALSWANNCAEEGLQIIRDDDGSNNLEYSPEGDTSQGCSMILDGDWPAGKVIKAEGFYKNYTKKIKIEVSEYIPKIVISSWEEVLEF